MMNISSQFVSCLSILVITILLFSKDVYSQNKTISVDVGLVLEMEDQDFGKMWLNCIDMALTDVYNTHPEYRTRIVLHRRDSKGDVVGAAAAALDLIKNVNVQAILGPVSSMQTDFVIDLGDKSQVPIITFSATSPALSSSRSPYFFRAALNDSSQVQAVSSIVKAFGWRQIVPIYVDNDFGEGIIPYLTDALQMVDARVPYRSVIPPLATDAQIGEELYKLMTMQTRVFVVHMDEGLGARVFQIAEKIGMMSNGYAWIVTNGIANTLNMINPSVIISSMQGALGVKVYVPESKSLDEFKLKWKRNFSNLHLSIFTLWAYDATFALAMAIENVKTTTFTYLKNANSSNHTTDLETIGTSRTGLELQQELATTRFTGLAGEFNLVGGQLQSSVFQFINVIGNGENNVGFWTPGSGISKELNSTKTSPYTTSKDDLVSIFWPGKTTLVPKGWVIPTNAERLKIGVPVKVGFREFVKVTINASTNTTDVDGYCIDVFKAVMDAMPYDVRYDFVPFAQPNGSCSGSYNDLIYQIYLQKYDAVVGDVTIVANRSKYVDFTLPFTESGVSMIVPVKDKKMKSAFIFMQPWTGDLWFTTACFFVFIGFVIWVLEHRINDDFRGPPYHQAGTMLWFSFSTMVFAHREKVVSNLARFVIIVWVFVVLILTQSYTASLSAMLTVEQLKPTFTDVNELIKSGEYVGYKKGSFLREHLEKMSLYKLVEYETIEECDELFAKGSAKGGIAAAFGETPYMRLFLDRYCSKYTMIRPVYKTAGFGFAFPIGSPLVSDVSRAILDVMESDKMLKIEKDWLGTQNCQDSSSPLTSHRLGTDSFWGLFVMAGAASISAFIIYAVMFLYENRQVLARPGHSIWGKMVQLFQHFDKKDISSHIFRKSEDQSRAGPSHDGMMNHPVPNSPNNFLQSPSIYSTHTSNNPDFFGESRPETPSDKFGEASPSSQTATERVWSVEFPVIPNDHEMHGDITEITHESN